VRYIDELQEKLTKADLRESLPMKMDQGAMLVNLQKEINGLKED
jgi:hypothetical protein